MQKYIEKPLLYRERKFDIRVWAVVTGTGEVFIFDEGYIRTSSKEYKTDAEDNYVHLTNNCLQRNSDKYGEHEEGNTISFVEFQEYLDEEFTKFALNFETGCFSRMKDIIIDCFMSVKEKLTNPSMDSNFELFGFDFLIDEDFRVWLLEVNANPFLGLSCSHLQ